MSWANGFAMLFRDDAFRGWRAVPGRGAAVASAAGIAPGMDAASLAERPGVRLAGSEFMADGNSGRIQAGSGFEIMVLGETPTAARAQAAVLAERLSEETDP